MKSEEQMQQERERKLKELIEMGINPYAYSFDQKHHAKDLNEKYSKLKPAEHTKDKVSVAGRIMLLRDMGKIHFMHLQDETEKIQLYFQKDMLKEKYKILKKLDLGDIIGAKGLMFKTKKGEVTVEVTDFELLTKSLLPPPSKFHGLKDTELRYRKRYLDLFMNPEIREIFKKRALIIKTIREYLDGEGFIEVETPTLQPVYGGASARPFVTRHNTLKMDMYLRISDELYLKRLLVGGLEKVYEIYNAFRNEGIDTSHNPEFTMLEWQEAYGDFETALKRQEKMFALLAKKVTGSTKVKFQGNTLDFGNWQRYTMRGAIKKFAKIDVDKMSDDELREFAIKNRVEIEKDDTRGWLIAKIFEETCEEFLVQPTFITEFPVETSPLSKRVRGTDGAFVERFEPYAATMEIGNNYSELNDPKMQKKHFEATKGEEAEHPVDEDYICALEHGMPPSSGAGVGVDRVTMLLTDSPSIRDVMFFPVLKKK